MPSEQAGWHIGQQHRPLRQLQALLTRTMALATIFFERLSLFAYAHIRSGAFCSPFGILIGSLASLLGRFIADPKSDEPTRQLFSHPHGHHLVNAITPMCCQIL